MKKLIVSALIATAAVPALAWGDREQGALAGIVGTIILQNVMRNNQPPVVQQYPQPPVVQQYPQPSYPYPPVVINVPPQHRHHTVCHLATEPQSDVYGNIYYVQRRVCQVVQ